jgi:hypothetical protein
LPGTIAGELLLLAGCCLPAADATGYAGCCYAGCSALLLFDKVAGANVWLCCYVDNFLLFD